MSPHTFRAENLEICISSQNLSSAHTPVCLSVFAAIPHAFLASTNHKTITLHR